MNTKTLARLHGSITALITPFTGEDVDYDAFRALVNWQIEQGTHGIVVAGTTGEHEHLSDNELKKLFGVAVDAAHGRVPVVAGCGDSSVDRGIAISRLARDMGVDYTLHVGGRQAVADAGVDDLSRQKALCHHFTAIHDATDIPIVMYNNPGRTGVNMRTHTISKISQKLPRVVGIKDCDSTPGRLSGLKPCIKRANFSLLTGDDAHTLANLEEGGHGCISVTANIAPAFCAQVHNAWNNGDAIHAELKHRMLAPVHGVMFQAGTKNPQTVKYASYLLGLANHSFRGDLKPISNGHQQITRITLQNAGIWEPQRALA